MVDVSARIDRAVEVLLGGGVVAFPTDTVYGVGALPMHETAIDRIYSMKGRPRTRALIIHVHEREALSVVADNVPQYARQLAEAFWPGALTLLLSRTQAVPAYVTGERPTVGLRMPNHPIATRLLRALNERSDAAVGIAAPSANRFGEAPAATAQEVVARLGAPGSGDSSPDMILDGGACPGKVLSTILDCTGEWPRLLRRGATSVQAIEDVIGRFVKQ
ncbi:MAG: threonylcarbamoyl-AMP synthase [Nannocystaceae bacterium]|nr:threonylcarbamoyl-AMP synthase [Nannocystaceae bacterium]